MAYYVWLNDEHEEPVNRRQWPMELEEWTENIPPTIHKRGWQVIPGSHVCENIPWRFLPATLYRVDVDGQESSEGVHSAWERAKLVEKYGTLHENQAVELAVAWFSAILSRHQHPTYYRNADTVGRLEGMERTLELAKRYLLKETDEAPLDKAIRNGYLPLIYMAKAIRAAETSPDPLMPWVYALYIPSEIRDASLKLELARVLSERLK